MFPILESVTVTSTLHTSSGSSLPSFSHDLFSSSWGKSITHVSSAAPTMAVSEVENKARDTEEAVEKFAIDTSEDCDVESNARSSNISALPNNASEKKSVAYIILHFSALSDIKK